MQQGRGWNFIRNRSVKRTAAPPRRRSVRSLANRTYNEAAVIEQVLKTISRYRMLAPGDRVIAAVSGGADSVCLVHALREAQVKLAGVAHFNHKLRGRLIRKTSGL